MSIFLKKVLSVFLILNHLWIFNIVQANPTITAEAIHDSMTSEGVLSMHPLTLTDGMAYTIDIDDNLVGIAENIPIYLYETTNNRIIGRLKRIGSVLEAYFEGVDIHLDSAPSTVGLKLFSNQTVDIGHLFHHSFSIDAKTVRFVHDIDVVVGISVIAETIEIRNRLKAAALFLKSSHMGTIKRDILSKTTAVFEGKWTNYATVAALGDISFLNGSIHNLGTSRIISGKGYNNACERVVEEGKVYAGEGALYKGHSLYLKPGFRCQSAALSMAYEYAFFEGTEQNPLNIDVKYQGRFRFDHYQKDETGSGKIMQNPDMDVRALLHDFLHPYFGDYPALTYDSDFDDVALSMRVTHDFNSGLSFQTSKGSVEIDAKEIGIDGDIIHGSNESLQAEIDHWNWISRHEISEHPEYDDVKKQAVIEHARLQVQQREQKYNKTVLKARESIEVFSKRLGRRVYLHSPDNLLSYRDAEVEQPGLIVDYLWSYFPKGKVRIDIPLLCQKLDIFGEEIEILADIIEQDKKTKPIIVLDGESIDIDVNEIAASLMTVNSSRRLVFNWQTKIDIDKGYFKSGDFAHLDENCTSDNEQSRIGHLTIDAPKKYFRGNIHLQEGQISGRSFFMEGKIQGGCLESIEEESFISSASLQLERLRAQAADVIQRGEGSNVHHLNLSATGYLGVSHMQSQHADMILQGNNGDRAAVNNCSFQNCILNVQSGTSTLSDVIFGRVQLQTQDLQMLNTVRVHTLEVKALGSLSIQTLHIEEKADIRADTAHMDHVSGNTLNVDAKHIADVHVEGVASATVKAGEHAAVSGQVTHAIVDGGKTATFIGQAEDVALKAQATSAVANATGIGRLAHESTYSRVRGTHVGYLDASSVLTDIDNVDVGTLAPQDGSSVHTSGKTRIDVVNQGENNRFTLSNSGNLTIKKAALRLQHLFNKGLISFLQHSSLDIVGTTDNRGDIKGRGSLHITAQNQQGLGRIQVEALSRFVHETPVKGRTFSYVPFTGDTLDEALTFIEEEIIEDTQNGFFSLDMDRRYAIDLIIEHLSNPQVRGMLAGTLLEALLDEDALLPDDFFKKTKDLREKIQKLSETDPKRTELIDELKGYCLDDRVLVSYITQVLGSKDYSLAINTDQPKSITVMDIIAALGGFALEVYVPKMNTLHKVHFFNPKDHGFEGEFETRRLLLTSIDDTEEDVDFYDHFNILRTDGEWGKRAAFLSHDSAHKGTLKLTLNGSVFTDDLLNNPNFKAENLMHYVLEGNQYIGSDHHFDTNTLIEINGRLKAEKAAITGAANLHVNATSMDMDHTSMTAQGTTHIQTTSGNQDLRHTHIMGQKGTSVISGADQVTTASHIGTTESATTVHATGNKTDGASKHTVHDGGQDKHEVIDASTVYGKTVSVNVGGNYVRQGHQTTSIDGTTILVDGANIEVPLDLTREVHTKIAKGDRVDIYADAYVNCDESAGDVKTVSGGFQTIEGSHKKGRTVTIEGSETHVKAAESAHVIQTRELIKSGWGPFKKRKEIFTQTTDKTPVKGILEGSSQTIIGATTNNVHFEGVDFRSPLTQVHAEKGKVLFDQAKNQTTLELMRTFSNWCSNSSKKVNQDDVTFVQNEASAPVIVSAKNGIEVKHIQGQALTLLKHLESKEGDVQTHLLEEIHKFSDVRKWAPGTVLSTVVAIAVAYFTMGTANGWGLAAAKACGQTVAVTTTTAAGVATTSTVYATTAGAIIGGMTTGAVTALSTSAALAVLGCNGDLREALKTLCSSQNMKSIMIQALAHGFMNGTIQHLDLPPLLIDRTFSQNLMAYGAKSAGYVGAKAIFYGSDAFRDVHKEVAQVVVQSLCVDLCKSIGQAYKSVDGFGQVIDGKLDYFSHKLMHGFVGALGGAVHGVDGIAAGAAGGIIGEVLGEYVLNNASMIEKMRSLQAQGVDQETILREHVDVKAFLVKLTAAVGVGLFGLDTQIAYDGADRAIENNLIPTLVVLASAALLGAYTAVTTNEILDALKHEGFEGAMRIAKAEVEVVMVTKDTAASLGGLPAAAASGACYMAYKVGGKLYLTAQKAWTALVKINPSLESGAVKNAFGNWLGKNGAAKAEVLTLKRYWNEGKEFTFNGRTNKVYQRDDLIDLNRVDPRTNLTNLELMRSGKAPVGLDNQPINLHHSIQEMNGPLIEMTQTMHSKNHGLLHIWPNKTSRVHGRPHTTLRRETLPEINRSEFGSWRTEYWKARAEQMMRGSQ